MLAFHADQPIMALILPLLEMIDGLTGCYWGFCLREDLNIDSCGDPPPPGSQGTGRVVYQ